MSVVRRVHGNSGHEKACQLKVLTVRGVLEDTASPSGRWAEGPPWPLPTRLLREWIPDWAAH